MPELPEVEVARLGITPHIVGRTIERFIIRNAALRWPVEHSLISLLEKAHVTHTSRRGKYLLLHCQCINAHKGVLLIHLGMSGSLRIVAHDSPVLKHDHIDWVFDNHILRYHDPRRFGSILWQDVIDDNYLTHPRLVGLGIEPFDTAFTGKYLYQKTQNKKSPIKIALLKGDMVVGVGNIYANEVLFRSKIHPEQAADSLSLTQCTTLAQHIRTILQDAINKGGSTLKDFVNSNGVSGYFQMYYRVYDRAGMPCYTCKKTIQRIVQAQRATYFCAQCQPLLKISK